VVLTLLDDHETRFAELAAQRLAAHRGYQAIQQVPGIGPVLAAVFVAEIGDVHRFAGPGIVKIGMTRRLDPLDRVRELGDASVPFGFDVHALFFADDAVGVEAHLHRHFAHQRVIRVNLRREYFYATPYDVKIALTEIAGNLLDFTDHAEAEQFHASELIRLGENRSDEEAAALPSDDFPRQGVDRR
jgi:hypothetical protein